MVETTHRTRKRTKKDAVLAHPGFSQKESPLQEIKSEKKNKLLFKNFVFNLEVFKIF